VVWVRAETTQEEGSGNILMIVDRYENMVLESNKPGGDPFIPRTRLVFIMANKAAATRGAPSYFIVYRFFFGDASCIFSNNIRLL
jgi:hypothetical protein